MASGHPGSTLDDVKEPFVPVVALATLGSVDELGRLFRQRKLTKRISTMILDPPQGKVLEAQEVDVHHGLNRKGKLEFSYLIQNNEVTEIKSAYKVNGVLIGGDMLYYFNIGGKKCSLKVPINVKIPTIYDVLIIDTDTSRYIVNVELDKEMEGYCKDYRELVFGLKTLTPEIDGYTTVDSHGKKIIFALYKY
ncbi:MAG: hypothetical protein Hyperionvirus1_97 [Hyperionvirus sp.]|uniref:Uncharacterized protein n=1 Tax=Hyperionvirus sp. TaxID=2487770 RepID=A0A3G5A5R5_9VIRU|nr:MAG: hypothetical protein Hyperionvirus1_97 [Hyperionvirus sp.]